MYSRLKIPYLLWSILFLSLCGCQADEKGANKKLERDDTLSTPLSDPISSNNSQGQYMPPLAVGDIDGNGRLDSVITISPNTVAEERIGEVTRIGFSSPSIPSLIDSMSVGGAIARVGDLDGNGTDDLLFLPDWPTSCWIGMRLYGLQEGEWRMLGGGSYYRCNDDPYNPDSLAKRVHRIEPGIFDLLQDTLDQEGEAGIIRAPVRFDIRSRLPSTE